MILPAFHVGRRLKSRVLASYFSSKTPNPNSADSLFARVEIIREPGASVTPVLEQWTQEGGRVSRGLLRSLINFMKELKRFRHALEIFMWMTDHRYFVLTPDDVALRLDLISRVQGVELAEKYFNSISAYLKDSNTYGALLNIYVREKDVEKAEKILQQMRELEYATASFPYNMMIYLYAHTGNHGKIDEVLGEMERMQIPQDTHTLRNRMSACVEASDTMGLERILRQIEAVPFCIDWRDYAIASSGYLKAGLMEETLLTLRKAEEKLCSRKTELPLDYLMYLYASVGRRERLYKLWRQYKTSLVQVSSFPTELNDDLGPHDFRALNRRLFEYCTAGHFDKAESIALKAVAGRMASARCWNVLAKCYMEAGQMGKAVEMMKKALVGGWKDLRPDGGTLAACLEWLEGQGAVEEMEEMVMLMMKSSSMTSGIYNRLLRTCVIAGRSTDEVLERMKMDGFRVDEKTQSILGMAPDLDPGPMLLSHGCWS